MLKSPVGLKTPQNTIYLVYRMKKQDDQPLASVEQSELQPAFVVGEDWIVVVVLVVVVYLHDDNQISYRYEHNHKLTPCKQGPHRSSQLIFWGP